MQARTSVHFSPHRRGSAGGAMLSAIVGAVLSCSAAAAQQSAPQRLVQFKIPPSDLQSALLELSDQAGVQIILASNDVRGLSTPGVSGTLEVETALNRLLDGSGLKHFTNSPGTITIAQAGTPQQRETRPAQPVAPENESLRRVSNVEELTVTARKREEPMQDVPIAITAVTGEVLRERNVSSLSELAPTISNFQHNEAVASSDQFIIRGLGTTGVNEGFDQAVGQVIDGFYYGRSRFGRTMMLDLERVEVLKGPQGALIGKNTSVGAINLTTQKPGDQFNVTSVASYAFEGSEGLSVESTADLPVSDTLRTRVAARYEDQDGWMRNAASGDLEQSREDLTLRAAAEWEISRALTAKLMYQYGDLDRQGRNRELFNCVPDPVVNPNEDCTLNNQRNVSFIIGGQSAPEVHNTSYDLAHLTLSYAFENATLTSLTGRATYDYNDSFDSDWSALELTHFQSSGEEFEQFSQEIRLTSTGENTVDYIAGLYFNDNQIDYAQNLMFCRGAPAALAASCTAGPNFRGITRYQAAVLDTSAIAAFAQADWHITQQLTLTVGGRFTREEKDVTGSQRPTLPYTQSTVDCPNATDALDGQGTRVAFNCPGPAVTSNAGSFSREADDFSPNVTLRFKPLQGQMLYATFAQGFKSGGYMLWPTVAQSTLAANVGFDDEKTVHLEIGGKHEVLDGSGRFNWAIWQTKFEDIQISSLDPVLLVQRTGNAAEATSKGVEADVVWSPINEIGVTGSFAYTDAEFDSYLGAPCFFNQTAAMGCIGGVQDLSGKPLPFAPELQFSAGLSGFIALGDRYDVSYEMLYYWRDDQFLQLDQDPIDFQEAYGKVNATVSFGPIDGHWRVALVGKNLTDELTYNFSNDTAALGPTGGAPHFAFSELPRTLALQVRTLF